MLKEIERSVPSLAALGEPFGGCHEAAHLFYKFGFNVIPIESGSKKTAVRWDPWLENLSSDTIDLAWIRKPFLELGVIAGDKLIVFDADSPESIASLIEIETAFGITPNLIVNTTKGVHHYFKRAEGVYAKSDAHDTKLYPNRIDVKTGRAMIVLPPSTGKEIEICDAENADDLVEVGQDLIDAVFRRNGRPEHRPTSMPVEIPLSLDEEQLKLLLKNIDPDKGYDDWLRVGMALYNTTGGSQTGLSLYDNWSSKGAKYKGIKEITLKWNSFKQGSARPITIATIYKMAGGPVEKFEIVKPALSENPLDRYSLRGKSEKVEAYIVNAKPILGNIAYAGQLTVIYAEFNSGKTLITLHLLIESIENANVSPENVYYLNMDDSSSGLLEKIQLADEYGFHMLSEGYEGFTSDKFVTLIKELIETKKASGVIIILDTLKKFVDLMSKSESSQFANVMREFALKGGTLIALAHTNKNKVNGKSRYGGTNDILSDFDCGYVMDKVSDDDGIKIVEFNREKGRGNNSLNVSYSYGIESSLSYSQILTSVKEVDSSQLVAIKQVEQQKADEEIIASVKRCIGLGINKKMELAKAVAKDMQIGRQKAIEIMEKYQDQEHHWQFKVGAKGAKIYSLN